MLCRTVLGRVLYKVWLIERCWLLSQARTTPTPSPPLPPTPSLERRPSLPEEALTLLASVRPRALAPFTLDYRKKYVWHVSQLANGVPFDWMCRPSFICWTAEDKWLHVDAFWQTVSSVSLEQTVPS